MSKPATEHRRLAAIMFTDRGGQHAGAAGTRVGAS